MTLIFSNVLIRNHKLSKKPPFNKYKINLRHHHNIKALNLVQMNYVILAFISLIFKIIMIHDHI